LIFGGRRLADWALDFPVHEQDLMMMNKMNNPTTKRKQPLPNPSSSRFRLGLSKDW